MGKEMEERGVKREEAQKREEKVVQERMGKGSKRGEDREERVNSTELMEERGEDREERVDCTELMEERGETFIS